ncbi:MAG: acyltransferase [Burkholderiaceae bacterium]
MRSQQTPYLERLDHLRLLAAALVVAFHAFHRYVGVLRPDNPLLSLVDEGHTGIGLFMVISGFIFAVIADGREIGYWGFLRNRLIRIYPLFLFGVFLTLTISTYNEHRNYGFATFLEWALPFRASTVSDSAHFVQLWTIWVEFQFYLIFPFLHRFAQRYGARYLWGLLLLLVAVRAGVYEIYGSVRFVAYESLFGRLDQFLVGMLAARLWLARPGRLAHPAHVVPAALAVLALVHWFNRQGGHVRLDAAWWIAWTTVEAFAWAWLMLAWLGCRWRAPAALERGLAAMGAVSFSVYVMHNFVIAILDKLLGAPNWTGDPVRDAALFAVGVAVPCALLAAWPTYLLIERPFLALRGRYAAPAGDPAAAKAA